MKTWQVTGSVVASTYLSEVTAETPEEALEKAQETLDLSVSVCNQCSDGVHDPAWKV